MGKIKNILLVVNPISGAINKKDLIEDIKGEVENRNSSFQIFRTTGEEDTYNLKIKIKEIQPDRILIAGGDGTIKIVAEALEEKAIPLGIIPVGSANGLAVNLDLPADFKEQLKIALGESSIEMDIILIDGHYCLHMSDFGLNAQLIKKYENSSIRGKLGYLLQSIPTLVESDYPFHFRVEVEGKVVEREAILLAIANAHSYGTGAKVNPDGKPNDGVFEILLFKNFDFLEIMKTLRNEVELDPDFVEIITAKKATITCKKPIDFQIDGEYLGKRGSVEVKILPNRVRIASPIT